MNNLSRKNVLSTNSIGNILHQVQVQIFLELIEKAKTRNYKRKYGPSLTCQNQS